MCAPGSPCAAPHSTPCAEEAGRGRGPTTMGLAGTINTRPHLYLVWPDHNRGGRERGVPKIDPRSRPPPPPRLNELRPRPLPRARSRAPRAGPGGAKFSNAACVNDAAAVRQPRRAPPLGTGPAASCAWIGRGGGTRAVTWGRGLAPAGGRRRPEGKRGRTGSPAGSPTGGAGSGSAAAPEGGREGRPGARGKTARTASGRGSRARMWPSRRRSAASAEPCASPDFASPGGSTLRGGAGGGMVEREAKRKCRRCRRSLLLGAAGASSAPAPVRREDSLGGAPLCEAPAVTAAVTVANIPAAGGGCKHGTGHGGGRLLPAGTVGEWSAASPVPQQTHGHRKTHGQSHKQAAARTLLRAARICARSVSGTSRNLLLAPAHWKVSKEKKKRVKKKGKK